MARLRDNEDSLDACWDKEKYEADNKDELKDNILFLFEQVRADSFYNLSEAVECLRDILKNYHANVILDFIDS
ncbi:hypothetical protein [Aliarcobacter cryaerophilus]|uniref:hypothetical protein n=1 Tax=Aliarcobacter cryaerophilus TaxID=28198 RepID=UPI001653FCFD|nr:hypothetical protein [Aliarcobacter cryaerophilus]QNM92345.1 hypothetical protein HOO33_00420 [Aliarcobacter cryaerophilus]